MFRLVIFASLVYGFLCTCPDKFDLVRNGECYSQYDESNYMWCADSGQAKYQCGRLNSQPVIIRNQEDHDYWLSVAQTDAKKGDNYGNLLLGIECDAVSTEWKWMDGSEITFRPPIYDISLDYSGCGSNPRLICSWYLDPKTTAWTEFCNSYLYVDIYCVIPHDEAPQPDQDCTDFNHDEDDDVCYQVGETRANWAEANTICRSFGANVASVHNNQENSFLRRLAVSKGLLNGMMLGGSRSKNNSFAWIDGSDWDYDNFSPGFPNGSGDCLEMETNNVNGKWKNINCSEELPFACIRQTTDAEQICDGMLRKEGDIIYSPGFPYNSSEPCDFFLKVDPGMLVEVEILQLEGNSCCDHLILNEGTLGGKQIADLTGDRNNGKKFRTTSQNLMRASWQTTNGAVNVKGMMITFRGVSK